MLFEFYKTQNAKKPKSAHATYLITGRRKPLKTANAVHEKDGEDVSMTSSPPFSSFHRSESEQQEEEASVSVSTLTLVEEEDLEEVKGQYEEIQSIFVYSLEPGPIQDLQLLSECNRRVAKEYAGEDPMIEWKKYGVIQNPNVKRRSTRQPLSAGASTSASASTSSKAAAPKKEESKDKSSLFPPTKARSTAETTQKVGSKPSMVRRDSSNISSMFANAKAKPKTKSAGSSAASPANAASPAEDSPMKDVEDDEAGNDDDFVIVDDGKTEAAKQARKDREEKLRAMMDEDEDEEMADADPPVRPEPVEEMEQEAEVDDSGALDAQPNSKGEEEKEDVEVEGGRRRGRRKVMKKKTTKDEDGFLVTTEEAVWESFSEDEPESKKAKIQPSSFGAAKGGKKAAKGQGNIMNFFKKG